MSDKVPIADAEIISKFLVKSIAKHKKGNVETIELAERIQEIELETQILGASFLKFHIIDPELTLTNSPWLKVNEGLLEPIEVEFPEHSKWMWTLCAVEGSTMVGANLEVTFESSLVAKLRAKWGPKQAPPGTRTRAAFVRDLCQEAKVPCVIPGVHKVQPIAEEEAGAEGAQIVRSGVEKQKTEEKVNKTPGIGHGSNIKIQGATPTKQQLADINTAMKTANKLKAPPLAVEALIAAGIAESGFHQEEHENNDPNNPHQGIWQSDVIPGNEVARQAEHFLIGGESFKEGGALKLAKETPPKKPGEIAQAVEIGGSLTSLEAAVPEAKAIIQESGGVGSGSGGTAESDVAQLTRGTSGNPDEDSWETISRMASQVNWFAFTSQVPSHPETLFYMDGPELAKQKVAAYVNPQENYVINVHTGRKEIGVVQQPATFRFDNTTFEFRVNHKAKQKVQRKSKIAKPSSPSQVRVNLVCGMDEYRAGDVFVLRGFGPAVGRWICVDAVRHCLRDTFTEFTLELPPEPLPEPLATSKQSELTGESEKSIAGMAKKALAEQQQSHLYHYSESYDRSTVKLFGAAPRIMDCSGFASLCYKEAGVPVPGMSGSSLPATNEMIGAMKKATKEEPGFLCFYGSSTTDTQHVTVCVGGGKVISMGSEGDPSEGDAASMGPAGFLGAFEP